MILNLIIIGLLVIVIYILVVKKGGSSDRMEKILRDEMCTNRQELQNTMLNFSKQVMDLTQANELKLENVRKAVEERMKSLQDDNNNKLEQIRVTVDEKLQTTLEKRLGESFKTMSSGLEQVFKSLGEMQTMAKSVGDLKNILSNVKARGIFGESQLGSLLEQFLSPEQYERAVATKKGSRDHVEFAVKLPRDKGVWLPIDAKFPTEDYENLVAAQNQADIAQVELLGKALEARIKAEAKDIRDKYIDPPNTTDFAILFLPFESLYAEVLRRPGLFEFIQKEYHVTIAGPTTIAAFLNSLQMGFKTIAVEKKAGEIWNLLGAIKTEFTKFEGILDKISKQLLTVSNSIDEAQSKSKTITRKLKAAEALPVAAAEKLLNEDPDTTEERSLDQDIE